MKQQTLVTRIQMPRIVLTGCCLCVSSAAFAQSVAAPASPAQPSFWSGFASATALALVALLAQRWRHQRELRQRLDQRQEELDQVVARRTADLLTANRTLRDLADTDALTGISNRRHFDRLLREGFERALLTGRRLSVLLIDVDHFKRVNDSEGHLAGDQLLRELGQLLQNAVRSDTVVARYGGEEFAVISPSGLREAVGLAERLRRAVEADSRIRISIGVASFEAALDGDEPALLARADRALYAAKEGGRNRVQSDPPGALRSNAPRRSEAMASD